MMGNLQEVAFFAAVDPGRGIDPLTVALLAFLVGVVVTLALLMRWTIRVLANRR